MNIDEKSVANLCRGRCTFQKLDCVVAIKMQSNWGGAKSLLKLGSLKFNTTRALVVEGTTVSTLMTMEL